MSISESSNRRSSEEKWVAAYYPNLAIEKPRSKAMLCLLFDKVICHFPITDMAHGGGSGMSENFGNDPLVEAGVIELREELLLPEIETNFSPGHYWGTDEEFDKYVCLQVTSMALNVCLDCGAVPVTDRDDWPIPAAIMDKVDLPRFAKLHGVALALQSLDIAIPISTDISSEDILEARDRLGEQLVPFR
jgi:hypothetical protein